MLPTEQTLSLLPPERFCLQPSIRPDACTKILHPHKCFANLLTLLTLSEQRFVVHPFMRVRRCVRKRVSKNLLTRFLTACSDYPKTNSACLSQKQPPEKVIRKDYSRFCSRVHIIFPTAKKFFPLQNKNQVRELIC